MLWAEISSTMGCQLLEWELELETTVLHSLPILVPLLPPRNTHVFRIEVCLYFISWKLKKSLAFMSTSIAGVIWVAFVYLFHTHTVCLAWQPAGLNNNKASVEVSKQLMAWGTEGTPAVAACHRSGWWSEQARRKASLFAGKLENQCVSCVLVSLPFSWLRGRMFVQQSTESFQASTHFRDVPACHITTGSSEKDPGLSV